MALCPQCQQPLPDAPERFCPHCGAELAPAARVTPWEERERIGFISALVETTQQILTRPTDFFRAMPVTGGLGSPLFYGVIVGYVGIVASAIYGAIFQAVAGPSLFGMSHRGELDRFLPYLQGGLGVVFQIVLGPLLVAVALFISSAILHVLLLLFGGAPRGFEATFRVRCYAEAASVIRLIPFCGTAIFVIYILILAIVGLSEAHRIGRGRAAAAVLVPLLLFCCCCTGVIIVMLGGLASALGNLK
jgi:hypothetical protein